MIVKNHIKLIHEDGKKIKNEIKGKGFYFLIIQECKEISSITKEYCQIYLENILLHHLYVF